MDHCGIEWVQYLTALPNNWFQLLWFYVTNSNYFELNKVKFSEALDLVILTFICIFQCLLRISVLANII